MDARSLALQLNCRQYREEITPEEEALAKDNGLIVIFGASDDLVEIRGAIDEELGGEASFLILKPGEEYPVDEEDETYKKAKELTAVEIDKESQYKRNRVEARWTPEREDGLKPSWDYKTDIPHNTFNIHEDGELYCIGIVIDVKDLK